MEHPDNATNAFQSNSNATKPKTENVEDSTHQLYLNRVDYSTDCYPLTPEPETDSGIKRLDQLWAISGTLTNMDLVTVNPYDQGAAQEDGSLFSWWDENDAYEECSRRFHSLETDDEKKIFEYVPLGKVEVGNLTFAAVKRPENVQPTPNIPHIGTGSKKAMEPTTSSATPTRTFSDIRVPVISMQTIYKTGEDPKLEIIKSSFV